MGPSNENHQAYYICYYRRSVSASRCITTTPDHKLAVLLLQSFNDLELANYRRARRRKQKNRERPRSYFITSSPAYRGATSAIRAFHRWAKGYYGKPTYRWGSYKRATLAV